MFCGIDFQGVHVPADRMYFPFGLQSAVQRSAEVAGFQEMGEYLFRFDGDPDFFLGFRVVVFVLGAQNLKMRSIV